VWLGSGRDDGIIVICDSAQIPSRSLVTSGRRTFNLSSLVYDFIFETKMVTASLAVLAAISAGAFVRGPSGLWWRSLLYSFGQPFAVSFFLVAPFSPSNPDVVDSAAGFFFEATVLFLYVSLLGQVFTALHRIDDARIAKSLLACLLAHVVLVAPQLMSEGFGLFSEGTRIDYLYGSALSKYFTYATIGLSAIEAGLVARCVSRAGSVRWMAIAVLALNFALSVVAGSKGAVFLWLGSVLALVDYRAAKFRPMVLLMAVCLVVGGVIVSAAMTADFLGITIQEFADLAVSRFFLNNDARALALDLRSSETANVGLFSESFRSIGSLFGYSPANPPLGVQLYDQYFGTSGNAGANASLAALITYYTVSGYGVLPFVAASMGVALLCVSVRAVASSMRHPSGRYLIRSLGLVALLQFSQDFLAFQVVMPMAAIVMVALWGLDRREFASSHRPSLGSTPLAPAR